MQKRKKPLYRKVNTKTHHVRHEYGGDFKHVRHKKRDTVQTVKGSMSGKKKRGLDYTPLFKFLLSKVGQDWDVVFKEAVARLDKEEPIFWMVSLHEGDLPDMVRLGESSYYSALYVDANHILQVINPNIKAEGLTPFCACCTHTFNGEIYR
jgi:hypothetical protein